MGHLFFKIFLWFWLGMVVVSATLLVSAALIHSRSAEEAAWRQKYGLTIDLRAERLAELFDRAGASAVQKFLGPLEQRDPMHDYLFDAEGSEVSGKQVPPAVLEILARMYRVPAGRHRFFTRQRMAAERAVGPSGRPYVLIMAFPPPPVLPRPLLQFLFAEIGREGILRLAAVLAVAAIFCFWLARHITSPIDKLRQATHEIAQEHLQARVGEKVTGRRDELAELGRDFNRMAERIDRLVSTQRRLLGDVSHELRSPLARLNLALGLARQRANPGASEPLDRIEREANRLNKLIGQLLTLARMGSGVDLERKRVFDLGVLVQEVAADGDYEARGRRCGVQFSPPAECMVDGVPEMLRGAIENVVRNAVRHTAEGTNVEITIDGEPGAQALLQVRDHGAGVAPDALASLFLPFYRAPDGMRQDPDGTGLGLAITERAFRLHGGSVTAANAPGGGLIITLELPRVRGILGA